MSEAENPYQAPPYFNRTDVARILNCSVLTIRNQEKAHRFPEPRRSSNNYRIYTLADVIRLQVIYHNSPNFNAILSILWDKGWQNAEACQSWLNAAMQEYTLERYTPIVVKQGIDHG